jgi:hypothetical protein
MARRALLLAIGLLMGCQREPTPLGLTGEQLMVHSVLVGGSNIAEVYVTRALPNVVFDPSNPAGTVYSRPVAGAVVRLIRGATTLMLSEAPAGFPPCSSVSFGADPTTRTIEPGCYAAAVPGGILAGERYLLQISLNGGAVQGELVVPAAPTVLSPSPNTRYGAPLGDQFIQTPVVIIPVHFSLGARMTAVRLSLGVDSVFFGGRRDLNARCNYDEFGEPLRRTTQRDSVSFVVHFLTCFRQTVQGGVTLVVPDSIHAHVDVTAFDSTYVGYYEAATQRSAEQSSLRAGITGALGLFAGAGIARTPVVLIRSR